MPFLHSEQAGKLNGLRVQLHRCATFATHGFRAILPAPSVEGVPESAIIAMQVLVPRPIGHLIRCGVLGNLHRLHCPQQTVRNPLSPILLEWDTLPLRQTSSYPLDGDANYYSATR